MTLYFFEAFNENIETDVVITGTNKEKMKRKYKKYEKDSSFRVMPYKEEPPIKETEDDFVRVIGDDIKTGDTNL